MIASVNRIVEKARGYLSLSRKRDESVLLKIGDVVVEVRVGEIHANRVSLLFRAPEDVKILRAEIANRPLRAA